MFENIQFLYRSPHFIKMPYKFQIALWSVWEIIILIINEYIK